MKARVVYWGTTSALYTGPGSFSVYLLNCNKKFQTRIETAGKPIWSTYFDRLPEATEWAYEFSDPHKALGLPKPQEGKPNMGIEDLIAKYKIGPNDAKELREFSEFLRLRKNAKVERVFAEYGVLTLHPKYTMGDGAIYEIPGTAQTRTMYRWVIRGNNGRMHVSSRDVDDMNVAEKQLKEVMEALQ